MTEVLGAGGDGIPESVRDAVLARAVRLSDPARRLLQAVAVVPGRVELWLLEALAGELGDRLDECLASGMLSSRRGASRFGTSLRGWRSKNRWRRIAAGDWTARHCARSSAPPVAEAGCVAAGASCGSGRRSAKLCCAGRRWRRHGPRAAGAHREAAAQYARALRFADRLTAETYAELLERRSYECFLTNGFDESIEALARAVALRRELGDAELWGECCVRWRGRCTRLVAPRRRSRWSGRLLGCWSRWASVGSWRAPMRRAASSA